MADAVDKDSKTEEATEKKIRDTIEQGKLPIRGKRRSWHPLSRSWCSPSSMPRTPLSISACSCRCSWRSRKPADGHRDRRHRALQDRPPPSGPRTRQPAGAADRCRCRRFGVPEHAAIRRRSGAAATLAYLDRQGLEQAVRHSGLGRVPEGACKVGFAIAVLAFTLSEDHRKLLAG